MFNLTGSEIVALVLLGLIVLGPEKLPDAVRKFTKTYNEFKKMATGFQGEVKQAFEEPMRELRGTADAVRKAADFDLGGIAADAKNTINAATGKSTSSPSKTGKPAEPVRRDGGLNFGNVNAKREERAAAVETEAIAQATAPDTAVQDTVMQDTVMQDTAVQDTESGDTASE